MYLIRAVVLLAFLSPALPVFAAQQSVEQMYQDARRHYYALFSSPDKMKRRSEWLRVADKFSLIVRNRPKTKRAADAQYTMGLLYKNLYYRSGKKEDKRNAIGSFERVIKNYSKSTLVDDAERHIGDINFHDYEYAKAAKDYQAATKRAAAKTIIKKKPSPKAGKTRPGHSKKTYPPAPAASVRSAFTELKQVQAFTRSGYTRIILHLSKRTAYRAERLRNPDRLFIDLLGARPAGSVATRTGYKAGLVRTVRMGRNSASVTRVVFDLAVDARYSVTSLRNPFRIVIDFGLKRPATAVKKPSVRPPSRRARYKPDSRPGRIKTIVLDPGHGGKDPGAIGPSGLKEKHVALAVSKKLKKILERRLHCRVVLTRSSDRFLELDERTVYANSLDADLFVSIHVNSSRNRRARGLETYFLSPARSKDELETAARENMRVHGGGNPVENDLAYIMSDMASTQKINDSVTLARSVQRSMVKGMRRSYHGVRDKGVKQAMFYVLWRATMPSILVETNFISNPSEERRLKSSAYQARLAEAIANGLVDYSRTNQLAMIR